MCMRVAAFCPGNPDKCANPALGRLRIERRQCLINRRLSNRGSPAAAPQKARGADTINGQTSARSNRNVNPQPVNGHADAVEGTMRIYKGIRRTDGTARVLVAEP